MNCCAPTIFPFNEAVTTVTYSPALLALYGQDPNVQVYYREGSQYVLSDDMNNVRFDGSSIIADHGGVQLGFLKVF